MLDELVRIVYDLMLQDYAHCTPQQFTVPLNPVTASRPRVKNNGAVYYNATYSEYKEKAKTACDLFTGTFTEKPVAVFIEHVVERPKKPSKTYPTGDLDNYDKAPLDAMVKSGKFFKDDVQVVALFSVKRYAKDDEKPAAHVTWFEITV